jgi:hypothetical protein
MTQDIEEDFEQALRDASEHKKIAADKLFRAARIKGGEDPKRAIDLFSEAVALYYDASHQSPSGLMDVSYCYHYLAGLYLDPRINRPDLAETALKLKEKYWHKTGFDLKKRPRGLSGGLKTKTLGLSP